MARAKEEKEKKKTIKSEKQVEKKKVKNEAKKAVKTKNKKSYVSEVKAELKKVKWPTKAEMVKYSIAVIIFIVVFGLYFYGLDAFFAWISSLVKGL